MQVKKIYDTTNIIIKIQIQIFIHNWNTTMFPVIHSHSTTGSYNTTVQQ